MSTRLSGAVITLSNRPNKRAGSPGLCCGLVSSCKRPLPKRRRPKATEIVLPFAKDLKISFIDDVRDTGAVAARILRDPDKHHAKTYELTGTQSTYEEFAKVFSEVLGKPVTYVEASLEAAEAG
jgi:hypothetical protein